MFGGPGMAKCPINGIQMPDNGHLFFCESLKKFILDMKQLNFKYIFGKKKLVWYLQII